MNDNIKVLLVDDHALLRKGILLLLDEEADIDVIGEAGDGEQAIAQVRTLKPDVVVMDINMPGTNGIEATRQIIAEAPDTRVIALSINTSKRFVDDMLCAGAAGYLLKESVPEELLVGIRAVMRGDMCLSSGTTSTVVSAYVEGIVSEQADGLATDDIGILQTKLHRPTVPLDLVPRTRLLEQLDAGRVRPLILVSAPAGYGKSVLMSNWLEINDWPSAWLSLDKGDSDLRQFLSYFLAEIQSVFPNACKHTLSLVSAPQLPSLLTLAGSLTNELDAIERPCILLLDDYHHIDTRSPVNELLDLLLERPPVPLHLVILTRRDPPLQLLKLRAQDQITEIRMQGLSFTLPEVRVLLEKVTAFKVSEEAASNLQQEMEGWAVGLQLATLIVRHIKDPNDFLINLHGGLQQAQEYLVQEVLSHQSPLIHEWLLKTSILDRFCPSLCGVVCVAEVGNEILEFGGDRFIKEVLDGNLFTIALDTRSEWFRFHNLFQHLLQIELERHISADEIAGLHLRASEWFEGQGLIEEAIRHALNAKDMVRAAEIIEQHQQAELNQDRWYNVERWIAMLPQVIIKQRPRLLLIQAAVLYNTYQMLEIPPLIDRVESLLVGENVDETLLGEINFYRGFMLTVFQGDAEAGLIQLEKAQKRFTMKQAPIIAGHLEILVAIASQMVGKGELTIRHLDQRIHAMGSVKDMVLERLIRAQLFVHMLSGCLATAVSTAQRLTSVYIKTGIANSDSEIWSRCLQANADFQLYHLDEALPEFQYGAKNRGIWHRKAAIEVQVGLVLTYQALQRADDALGAMKQLMGFALDTGDPEHIVVAQSCQARLSLLQGDSKTAITWAHSFDLQAHAPSMLIWLEIPVITYLRVMVATGSRKKLQQANELVETLHQSTEALHNTYQTIELMILHSLLLERLGYTDEALEALRQAIQRAQPAGWIRPFVELGRPMAELLSRFTEQKGSTDYLRRVLDHCLASAEQLVGSAVGKSQFISGSEVLILEHLTKREFEILDLLAQRLQNKEIAARLFISPETVKYHLKHLYQKLDVHNRREAGVKAAEIKAAGTSAVRVADHIEIQ